MWGGRKTKRQRVDDRHERAMDIADGDVRVVSQTQWRVRSQGGGGGRYDVYQDAATCPLNACRDWDRCFAQGCRGLCGHMYHCTCPDENTLCKHIHKVRIVSIRATQTPVQQAAATRSDKRWRQKVNVDRKVRNVRSTLKEIGYALDKFDSDALAGVIGKAEKKLSSISAKIYSHCERFEDDEDVTADEDDSDHDDEDDDDDSEDGTDDADDDDDSEDDE